MKERMILIDGWNMIIAQNAVANILDHNSQPIGTYLTVINQIRSLVEKFKPNKVFFVLDGPNAGQRRRSIYPQYKNKRRITARTSKAVIYNEDDKSDKDVYEVDGAYEKQLNKIYDFLKLLPVSVIIIPYCEADDVITYLAQKNQEEFDVIISSTDKDYLQNINKNISVYNWRKKIMYNQELFLNTFKILPENYIYQKILLGDKSDNIINIKSIGIKTFSRLFEAELSSNKSLNSLEDFFVFIDKIDKDTLEKKYIKYVDLLREKNSKDSLLLNFQLIKLSSENLKQHHIELLKVQVEEQKKKLFSKLTAKIKVLNDSFNKLYGIYSSTFNADKFLQPFVFVNSKLELSY